jgi:hypothetical protein
VAGPAAVRPPRLVRLRPAVRGWTPCSSDLTPRGLANRRSRPGLAVRDDHRIAISYGTDRKIVMDISNLRTHNLDVKEIRVSGRNPGFERLRQPGLSTGLRRLALWPGIRTRDCWQGLFRFRRKTSCSASITNRLPEFAGRHDRTARKKQERAKCTSNQE